MSAGDHWVLALGPETYRSEEEGPGLYEWAVLSDRDRVGLSVLTRDVQRFEQDYGPEVGRQGGRPPTCLRGGRSALTHSLTDQVAG